MSAAALSIIARLQEAGATLECKDGGRVRFSAPVPLPAALLAEARKHREAIAAALTATQCRRDGLAVLAGVGKQSGGKRRRSGEPNPSAVLAFERRTSLLEASDDGQSGGAHSSPSRRRRHPHRA